MRQNSIFLTLTTVLLISQFLFSQKLFLPHNIEPHQYRNMLTKYADLDVEMINQSTLFYQLNQDVLAQVLEFSTENIEISLPFFNDRILTLDMELFEANKQQVQIIRQTHQGVFKENYSPRIKTYRIKTNSFNTQGVFVFSANGVKAVFSLDQKTYQIDLFNTTDDNIYFMTSIQDSPLKYNFRCATSYLSQIEDKNNNSQFRINNNFGCVEVAIEIDYYTFQYFGSYQEAVDWAMEILAVASAFYLDDVGVELKSGFAQIWETEDPYSSFIAQPNDMLYAIRENWNNQDNLTNVNRDLVHLFSKRNNTGTGGIAFLNGVGSLWNGYGFSSNLTDTEEYIELPEPYFFWNIYCLMHELGHNFGAKHTQWCGWPEGPIDNCANIESIIPGECSEYTDEPSPAIGTIMSYCHTWSTQSGGGIIMKFHETVKSAMTTYLGLQDLENCNETIALGCLDESACNFDSEATEDDGNCVYAELYYDCAGICLNDDNNNDICDEQENVSLDLLAESKISIYPNPANDYLNIKQDNLFVELESFHILNSLGQLVLQKSNLKPNETIDVSSISPGLYAAYLTSDSKIFKENIIIQ